ncbi:MAG: hypothetical protein ACJ70S_07380 [Nitrososphaera sp.]
MAEKLLPRGPYRKQVLVRRNIDRLMNHEVYRVMHMSERKDKTPEQVADEDYKVAPTSADEPKLKKHYADTNNKEEQQATGENYQLPTETKIEEETREGVE